jgi:hypothetical protein
VLERADLVDPEIGVEPVDAKRRGEQRDDGERDVLARAVRLRLRLGGYAPPRRDTCGARIFA